MFAVKDYISVANSKYNYNPEQALGVLYWHKYNFEHAFSDLANYLPYPDEWSMEDRALFDQAYSFYNKNFHRISTLLPDKKISNLVKYYYTRWKKTQSKSQSNIQKQINRKPSQNKEDSNDSVGNDVVIDSETEFVIKQECALCQTQKSSSYYNTILGLLCNSCHNAKSKDGSISVNNIADEGLKISDDSCLPNGMTKMILNKKILTEIAREREANITRKAVESLELQITEVIRDIREYKQMSASIKESIIELPDMSSLIVSYFQFLH